MFLAAAVSAGVFAVKDGGRMKDLQSLIDERAGKIAEVRGRIGETNLESRAFSESLKNIPEDRRLAEMGRITEKTKEFNKIIRVLEKERKDLTRVMHKHQRERDEVKSRLKNRLLLYGGAALLFLAGFLACTRLVSIRT